MTKSPKRKGLGRGLGALLGDEPAVVASSPTLAPSEIGIDRLEPNRFQPRSQFDESGLEELAESIRQQGVVQPIVVTPAADGRYTIVAGERRWRASRRAGLERVPVVVREVADDQQLLEMALVENIQRADLNPIEEAEAYRILGEKFELSQEEIARRVGKGRTTITNVLRLLRLPAEVQDLMREGRLTAGQARPILALDPDQQIEVAERASRENLTARELEALASAAQRPPRVKTAGQETDVHTRDAVEKLSSALQTRVEIVRKRRGGTVRIHFHSEDELIRLYDHLMSGE
ncbi:MAG: ParB/RepB/Spo0J family partition protein [Acidobacteriota bacterium]